MSLKNRKEKKKEKESSPVSETDKCIVSHLRTSFSLSVVACDYWQALDSCMYNTLHSAYSAPIVLQVITIFIATNISNGWQVLLE